MKANADVAAVTDDARTGGLLAWQLRHYTEGHTTRANLALHAITAPSFCAGTLLLAAAPFTTPWLALGAFLVVGALLAQGRGHRGEANRPYPFRGPGDFVARFFLEQWVTFPRFVLGGGFTRAWRATRR